MLINLTPDVEEIEKTKNVTPPQQSNADGNDDLPF